MSRAPAFRCRTTLAREGIVLHFTWSSGETWTIAASEMIAEGRRYDPELHARLLAHACCDRFSDVAYGKTPERAIKAMQALERRLRQGRWKRSGTGHRGASELAKALAAYTRRPLPAIRDWLRTQSARKKHQLRANPAVRPYLELVKHGVAVPESVEALGDIDEKD